MRSRWLACSVVAFAAASAYVVGCVWPDNPDYCEGHPGDSSCSHNDAGIDAPDATAGCSTDQECVGSGSGSVCDVSSHTCVQCTTSEASACTGTAPICGSDDACRGCAEHSECSSDVCLPDGSCDSGSDVAYVSATGGGSACTKVAPCGTFAAALATAKPYIKFSGTGTINEQVTINNQNVTILADAGASLSESTAGTILTVSGTSQVSIYGLTITGGLGTSGVGIAASTGSTLVVNRSTISLNAGGGISIDGAQFHIENTFITQNGGVATSFGGVKIDGITMAGTYELDFNTIAGNGALSAFVPGVQCGDVAVPVIIDSDIIYGDTGSATELTAYADPSPECVPTYSDIGGSGVTAGAGNLNADPLFVSPSTSPGDFHIKSGSPCIGKADPASTLDVDFDGDSRPQGSGRDIGADEFRM